MTSKTSALSPIVRLKLVLALLIMTAAAGAFHGRVQSGFYDAPVDSPRDARASLAGAGFPGVFPAVLATPAPAAHSAAAAPGDEAVVGD